MGLLDEYPNRTLAQQRTGRRAEPSGVIGVHTAENTPDFVAFDGGAEAVWNFIRTRTTYGSYHALADSDSWLQVVDWWNEAFHIGTDQANWHAVGISAATRADVWPVAPKDWRDGCIDNLARAAAAYARWLKAERGIVIPARRITRADANRRIPGFVAHGDMDPGRRSDPGVAFPWDQFLTRYSHHAADTPTPAPPSEEDDMTPEQSAKLDAVDLRVTQLQAELLAPFDDQGRSRADRMAAIPAELKAMRAEQATIRATLARIEAALGLRKG